MTKKLPATHKPPAALAQLRFVDATEVARIFAAGLVHLGKLDAHTVTRVWVDGLDAFSWGDPPAVVVDILSLPPKDGAKQ